MILDCGVCVVRDWRVGDKASLLRVANNRRVWQNLTHMFPHPYTEADADWWFSYLAQMPEPTHWAIEIESAAIGGIGITLRDGVFERSAHFGYWLGEPF